MTSTPKINSQELLMTKFGIESQPQKSQQKGAELLTDFYPKSVGPLTEAEAFKLIHELQVQQVELELLNHELMIAYNALIIQNQEEEKQAAHILTEGERKDASISQEQNINVLEINEVSKKKIISRSDKALLSADVAWWEMDVATGLVLFEKRKAEMLGYPPEKFRHYNDFMALVHPDDSTIIMDAMRRHYEGVAEKFEVEYRILSHSGSYIWCYDIGSIVKWDSNRKPLLVSGLVLNITPRKKAEEEMHKANTMAQTFFSAIEQSPVTTIITDLAGTMTYVSPKFTEITGYAVEEAIGRNCSMLKSGRKAKSEYKELWDTISSGKNWHGEFENKKKNGEIYFESAVISPVKDQNGVVTNYLAIKEDITERKKILVLEESAALMEKAAAEQKQLYTALRVSENELSNSVEQLHKLSQYVDKVREEERIAISRDLHDDLGQALTAVNLDLGIISQQVKDPKVEGQLEKLSMDVIEIIRSVQRITSQLRPQIIEDFGIGEAIKWYITDFKQRTGIEFQKELCSGIFLEPDTSLTIFRIMQESLTNIARHSKATRVRVKLSVDEDLITFMIADNGIGITEDQKKSPKSFGLLSMKERASSLGGTFDIYRENDYETVVMLNIPLKYHEEDENSDL